MQGAAQQPRIRADLPSRTLDQPLLREELAEFRRALVADIRTLLREGNTSPQDRQFQWDKPLPPNYPPDKIFVESPGSRAVPTQDEVCEVPGTLPHPAQNAPTSHRSGNTCGGFPKENSPGRHRSAFNKADNDRDASKGKPAFHTVLPQNVEKELRPVNAGLGDDETEVRQESKEGSEDDTQKDFKKKGTVGAFAAIMERAHRPLDEDLYSVSQYYSEEGCFQHVARKEWFAKLTLMVIVLNAAYIGVEANNNTADFLYDAHWSFVASENIFCVIFGAELVVRLLAFRVKCDCLKDTWFKFDACLVVLMIVEVWILPIVVIVSGVDGAQMPTGPLRLLRLLRLSRMARLLRSLPELLTMVQGIKAGARAVGSSLLMVTLLIYVFSIVMHMILKENPLVEENFSTLPLCMWTLLMDGTLMDSTGDVMAKLRDEGSASSWLSLIIFMLFILLSSLTVMNMLIGVLCEVVSSVANAEKDEAAIKLMKESILVELKRFDEDGNGLISPDELQHVMRDPQAMYVLNSLEVDTHSLQEMMDMILQQSESNEVTIGLIMDLMLMCRGDLPSTVKHLVTYEALTRWAITSEVQQMKAEVKALLLGPADPEDDKM